MRIFKSQLSDVAVFEAAVAQHIDRLHAFNFERGKPRPTAHPMIEACIKRVQAPSQPDRYIAAYEIVDDTLKTEPKPNLEDHKSILVQKLREAEVSARNKIVPQRKMRLWQLEYQMAASKPEDQRTIEDAQLLERARGYDAAFTSIAFKAAHAEALIEDLTESTIDSWQVPSFD